jgi:hypothetical protein
LRTAGLARIDRITAGAEAIVVEIAVFAVAVAAIVLVDEIAAQATGCSASEGVADDIAAGERSQSGTGSGADPGTFGGVVLGAGAKAHRRHGERGDEQQFGLHGCSLRWNPDG